MKKLIFSIFIIAIFLLTGCQQNNLQIELSTSSTFTAQQETTIHVTFKDTKGNLIQVNHVNVKLEMTEMDHGDIFVKMNSSEKGTYEGKAELPMEGKWLATITYTYNGKQEKTLKEFTIQAVQ